MLFQDHFHRPKIIHKIKEIKKNKSTQTKNSMNQDINKSNNLLVKLLLTAGPTLLIIFMHIFTDYTQIFSNSFLTFIYPKEKQLLFFYLKDGYTCFFSGFLLIGAIIVPIILAIAYKEKIAQTIKLVKNHGILFSRKINYIVLLKKFFYILFVGSILIITFVFSTMSFLGSLFNRVEFYHNEIRIYNFLQDETIFTKKIIPYTEIKLIKLDIQKGYSTKREMRYEYYYYIKLDIETKEDIIHEILKVNLFFIENEISNVLDIVKILKQKGVKIVTGIDYNDLLNIIEKNYYNQDDQKRIIRNIQQIFFVLLLEK